VHLGNSYDEIEQNLKLEIETARDQLEWDSLQFKKLKGLWEQKIGSENALEQAQLKYESTRNKLLVLQKRYKQMQSDLEKAFALATNRIEGEKNTLSDFELRAFMDGRVYALHKEEGEVVSPQEPIAEIGSRDSFKIEMDVDEKDVTRIKVGDTAIIALDAYPDEVYRAIVARVLPKKNPQNLTYTVQAEFIASPNLLYGLSGEGNIIVGKRRQALTLPPEYLYTKGSVMTENGEKAIEIGMKNMQFVEILSGIDSSTNVIKPE
jgi:multidrug efflux pump subunit AcrA (membrane-fusion protein)